MICLRRKKVCRLISRIKKKGGGIDGLETMLNKLKDESFDKLDNETDSRKN